MKIYVGNIEYSLDETQLKSQFEQFGEVDSVKIVYDRVTGRSKGFGFVVFTSGESADKAVEAMHGSQINGRNLVVKVALERNQHKDNNPSQGLTA